MSTIPRLVISAPSSGHGKTAISVGLLAALSARGYRAAGFKIGPDHVDAAYLGLAAGRPGRNLDPRMVGAKRMGPLFAHGAASLDIAVVEGTMGLFDGLAGRTDSESTAQISGLLRAPVILVVDVGAMGQSVAALVHGFRAYDELLWLGGVILNRVASSRHEQLLREALDDIGVPVLGALRRHALTDAGDAGAPLPSRHHGVAPVVHHNIDAVRAVRRLGEVIAGAVDIDRTMALARSAPRLTSDPWSAEAELAEAGASDVALSSLAATRIGRRPVVGVAFAYPETAELLAAAGAEVVPFDPLRDEALPTGVDGLVIGSALPESYAEELTFNGRLRSAVAAHAAAGKPIAAEGTGLVWLCRDYNGRPMCGVVDASARETDLVVLGYREATARSSSVLLPVGAQVIGHKMHRTSIAPRAGLQAAWTWAGGPAEGFVQRGVHASYLGLHWAGHPSIASRFVAAAGATANPAPGSWSTPSASPYGRPSVPLMTFTTAPVTGAPASAGTPSYGTDYTTPEPPRLPGTAIPGSILASPGGPGSIAAAPPPAASVSAPAGSIPSPAGPVSAPAGSASAASASASVVAPAIGTSSVPANAPVSPGASSPFGPALGPAMPTPWTSTSAAQLHAGSVASSSAPASSVPASSAPVSSAPVSVVSPAAPSSSQPAESSQLAESSSASGSSSAPVSSLPVSGAPAASTPLAAAPVSSASVAAASVSAVPVSAAPAGAGSEPVLAPAASSVGDAASSGSSGGESEPSYVADWSDESDLSDKAARSGGGLPAAGLVTSGPWSAARDGDDEATTVLPGLATSGAAGANPPTGTDEASVGVPSARIAPATGSGLPSSGVVPMTSDAVQPVSTPPVVSDLNDGDSAPATSAAMPVSSAPMPRPSAPVSAAPGGATAMPAADSQLSRSGEDAGAYGPAGAEVAEQAPVSAPPVSAPPSSGSAVAVTSISAAPVSAPVSGPPGSVVSDSMASTPVSASPTDPSVPGAVSAPPAAPSDEDVTGRLMDITGSAGDAGGPGGDGSGGGKPPTGGSSEAA
ncbi:MAG TPA: cobyrinate a,c-diamide synthase [Dactylosporangium sp.]|nr:cobyrinate a,c-diamide synthase [Dactylosporangium sp.]